MFSLFHFFTALPHPDSLGNPIDSMRNIAQTIVTDVTRDLIEDIYGMRKLNEPEMSVMAMRTIPREWLGDLSQAWQVRD